MERLKQENMIDNQLLWPTKRGKHDNITQYPKGSNSSPPDPECLLCFGVSWSVKVRKVENIDL